MMKLSKINSNTNISSRNMAYKICQLSRATDELCNNVAGSSYTKDSLNLSGEGLSTVISIAYVFGSKSQTADEYIKKSHTLRLKHFIVS